MASEQLDTVIRHLHRLVGRERDGLIGDGELLQRFVTHRDETAFEVLVWRHAALVLSVCRRILTCTQDVEDAFQATFLALVGEARRIVKTDSLAAWLHKVAYRVALKIKKRDRRPLIAESRDAHLIGADPAIELIRNELRQTLDGEIERLPAKYRAPFILCYLGGKTYEEAARQLRCPSGTVATRLAWARQRLRTRLSRRGVIFPGAILTIALTERTAFAAAPRALVQATLHTAAASGAGVVRAQVAALAEGVLRALIIGRLKLSAALLTAACVSLTTAGLVAHRLLAGKPAALAIEGSVQIVGEKNRQRATGEQGTGTDRYGDPLPPRALARMGTVRFRHGETVEAIALSADGVLLASAGRDETVRLWDYATGQELFRLPDHKGSLRFIAFSPDGRLLASGASPSGIVRLWEPATGRELRQFKSPFPWLGHVAFSSDGKTVAAASDRHRIFLWEVATGRLLRQFDGVENNNFAVAIAFSPDGRFLASGGTGENLRLWNLATGNEERRFVVQPPWPKEKSDPPNYHGLVEALAFSPDGRTLASAAIRAPVRLWEVATGKEIRSLQGDRSGAFSLAFSPHGRTLVSGDGYGMVRVWECTAGKEVGRFQAHNDWVSGLAFTPSGHELVTSGDKTIRLWDLRAGTEVRPTQGHTNRITSAVLLPNGQTLVTGGSDSTVRWWDVATGKELRRFTVLPARLEDISLSPAGDKAACFKKELVGENEAQSEVEIWDLASEKKLTSVRRPNVVSARFSPDSKTLFTKVWDIKERAGFIVSWDAATGKPLSSLGRSPDGYTTFELSPDGKVLAALTSGQQPSIYLWDVVTAKVLGQARAARDLNQCLAVSPDNRFLAVGDGPPYRQNLGQDFQHHIHLWHIAAGKEIRQFGGSSSGYWTVAFSPDGRMLAAAGDDKQIHLWELASGGERLRLEGHMGGISNLLFADNGRTLISTSSDTTALVWDLTGLRRDMPGRERKENKDLEDLWSTLDKQDAAKGYQAIWSFAAAGDESVAFLGKRLHPVKRPDEKTFASLVLDLDSPIFVTRQKAFTELSNMERLAEPALRKALMGQPSAEMRKRIQQLLEQLESPLSGLHLRSSRAVELLEQIGTPLARQALQALATGAPEGRLTEEAKASLERLGHLGAAH